MTKLITTPTVIKAAGNKEKIIKEFFGMVNSNTTDLSIAKMESPEGWEEQAKHQNLMSTHWCLKENCR